MNNSGIYIIENLINGNSYIGSAVCLPKRKEKHFRLLNNGVHPNTYLQNAFNLYKHDSFRFWVIEYCDKSILIQREQFWIDYYIGKCKMLYNIRLVAQSNFGITSSQETKEKLSKAFRGRILSKEHKENLSLSGIGKHNTLKGRISPMKDKQHTVEAKLKMSNAQKGKNTWMSGRKLSDETRRKMSESRIILYNNKRKVLQDEKLAS